MTTDRRNQIPSIDAGQSFLTSETRPRLEPVVARAEELGRLMRVFVGWPWTPQRWISNSAILMALSFGIWLMLIKVGWGDYGQWLMVSRAYLGEDVPEYRDISAIPPLSPVLIALISWITGSPLVALQILKGILAIVLVLSVYLAGKSIFQSRSAGLLAAAFAFFVSDRILELFAFGGIPQLTSMAFLVGSAGAIARASRDSEPSLKWWSIAAGFVVAAASSHVGTGLITVFSAGIMVGGVLIANFGWSWKQRLVVVGPFVLAGLALLAYYVPVLLPVNASYATNPASEEYRGPERIWAAYSLYMPNWIVLALGGFFLVDAVLSMFRARKLSSTYPVILWAAGVWLFLITAIVVGSSTDYPRFTAPLLLPLAVASGGGVAAAIDLLSKFLADNYRHAATAALPMGVALIIVLAVGLDTVNKHRAEARFYSLPELDSVRQIADWIESDSGSSGIVVAPTRSAKWIEGLSGRSTLMEIPVRFSFREWELERSIANQTVMRSSSIFINEQFLVRFTDASEGTRDLVPTSPWIGINHGGEYVDLLRIPSSTTRVFTGSGTEDLLATLGALEARSVDTDSQGDALVLNTEWSGARRGSEVRLNRTYELSADGNDLIISDSADSELEISGIQTEIWPLRGSEFVNVEPIDSGALITFRQLGSTNPEITITADDPSVLFSVTEDGLVATTTEDTLRLTYRLVRRGQPLHHLAYLTPSNVVEQYDVSYVVLDDSDASAAREERLSKIGFTPVFETGPYTVLGFEPSTLVNQQDQPPEDSLLDLADPVLESPQHSNVSPTATVALSAAPSPPTGEDESSVAIAPVTPQPSISPTSTPVPTPTPTPAPPSELLETSLWLMDRPELIEGNLLVAKSNDAEWIENLTGANSLSLSADLLADSPEDRDEAIVADTLLRSTTSLRNELLSLKFIDSKTIGDQDIPRQLWASGILDGRDAALLRLLPTESRVLTNVDGSSEVLATLNALSPASMSVSESEEGVNITTTWSGERRGGTVVYSRMVEINDDAAYFSVTDKVTGTAPISGIDVSIRPPSGKDFSGVEILNDEAIANIGGSPTSRFTISPGTDATLESREQTIALTATSAETLSFRISIAADSLDEFDQANVLVPAKLVADLDIEAVLIRQDGAFSARERRMKSLGFVTVAEFGTLAVMTMGEE